MPEIAQPPPQPAGPPADLARCRARDLGIGLGRYKPGKWNAISDVAVKWMVERFPGIGGEHDVIIPLVGECDDSWLNDVAGRHVHEEHVSEALRTATDGPVPEGSVGGGTGKIGRAS